MSLFILVIFRTTILNPIRFIARVHIYIWLLLTLIHILFEIIIIIKLFYLISKEVSFIDKLFLWMNFLYISGHFYDIIINWPKQRYKYFLKEYKNIQIKPYLMEMESYKKINKNIFLVYLEN